MTHIPSYLFLRGVPASIIELNRLYATLGIICGIIFVVLCLRLVMTSSYHDHDLTPNHIISTRLLATKMVVFTLTVPCLPKHDGDTIQYLNVTATFFECMFTMLTVLIHPALRRYLLNNHSSPFHCLNKYFASRNVRQVETSGDLQYIQLEILHM